MSFRVKLRIKSVKPYIAPVPSLPLGTLPKIETGEKLLRDLYEAAKTMRPIGGGPWTRRWAESPGLPGPRFNPTCSYSPPPGINWQSWNGGVQ